MRQGNGSRRVQIIHRGTDNAAVSFLFGMAAIHGNYRRLISFLFASIIKNPAFDIAGLLAFPIYLMSINKEKPNKYTDIATVTLR